MPGWHSHNLAGTHPSLQVCLISSEVRKRFSEGGQRRIRFAFVGYRDYGDDPNVQVLDFTEDLDVFQAGLTASACVRACVRVRVSACARVCARACACVCAESSSCRTCS